MSSLINFLTASAGSLGYLGIFILMFLESSFFPFPSEVVMIPAGWLAYQGKMSLVLAILAGLAGSYVGAVFNYFLAKKLGRSFLLKYGRYLFIKPQTLEKLDNFFARHGHISTFNGRLIPGVRQYISLPAGLAKMNFAKFSLYTVLGAGLWVAVLTLLGYFLGQNQALIKAKLRLITWAALALVAVFSLIYFIFKNKSQKHGD